jgi:hypothetical protein
VYYDRRTEQPAAAVPAMGAVNPFGIPVPAPDEEDATKPEETHDFIDPELPDFQTHEM